MRMLITGGAGSIGAHLAQRGQREGHQVFVLDNLVRGRRENVPAGVPIYVVDVCSSGLHRAVAEIAPDAIVHLAAQMNVRTSVTNPVHDTDVNVVGTVRLLQAAQACGVPTFVAASTGGAIYGEPAPLPTPEDQACAPQSPYGVSKLCSEAYLDYFDRATPMRCVALRLANVFGPRQSSLGDAGVVGIFARAMLAGHAPCLFGDGRQTRDYIFVHDVVDALMRAVVHPKARGPYNVGSSQETSLLTLVQHLRLSTGYTGPITFSAARPGELRRSALACQRAYTELGWRPQWTLADGLEPTVGWYRELTTDDH
jgi:UDP-glucose 4-epimerase